MARTLAALALAVALAIGLAGTAQAQDPIIGIGEQKPRFFSDPHFQDLGLKDVRVVVAWDALRSNWERNELDAYMAAAEEAGARVLLGFGHSRGSNEKRLPGAAEFRREFLRFRARYPLVRDYLTWNEANHCSQPTCRRPERAARYFDVVAANCRGCRVVAADVLDDTRVERWVRRFKAAARYKPRIWGIHNYGDANRFRTTGTRTLLRITKGEVWFTETGGLVERRNERRLVWPRSSARAARALEQVFKLARLSPRRVTRVYLYQWDPAGPPARRAAKTWDSALMDELGRPRPAYHVLRDWLAEAAARRARSAG